MSNEQGHTYSVPVDDASYIDVPPMVQFEALASESFDLHQKESELRREEESVQTTLRELNRRFLATQAARKKAEAEELTRQRLEAEAKVELDASRAAAERELKRLEHQISQREVEQTAKFQAEKDDRERLWLETQWFLEEEKQVQSEIERLQKAAADLARRKTALANLKAEQARIVEEEELRKQSEAHRLRLVELDHELEAARLDLLGTSQQEAELAGQLEHLKKTGAEQRLRLEEAANRLRTERENQIAQEMEALRRAASEQRTQEAEAESLRTAELAEQLRLAEVAKSEAHNKLEAAKELLQVQQDELSQLEAQLAFTEKDMQTSAAREVQLKSVLAELACRIEAQRQQVAEAEATQAAETAKQLREAEDARQRAEQTFNETAEAVRLITEEGNHRLAEATALRNRSQEESDARANELQQLRTEIEQLEAVVQAQTEETVTLKAQLAGAISNRESLEAQHREINEQCGLVTAQIEAAKQANLEAKSQHEQQLAQLASLEQQQSEAAAKRLQELEEHRQALQKEVEETEQREQMVLRELESLRSQAEQDSQRRRQSIQELEQQLAQLDQAARAEEEQHEQARALRATREENLQQAAETAAEEYEQEWIRLDAVANEHALLQSKRIAELKAKRAGLEEEQRQTVSIEQRIKNEIEAARQQLAELKKAQQEALAQLERSRDEVDEAVANERLRIKETRKHAEDEECRIEELEKMRAEIEAKLAACLAQRYAAANEFESVRATLAAAEKENRELESQTRVRVAEQQRVCDDLVWVREQLEEESLQLERVRQRSLDELDLLKHKTEELARRHTVEQERRLAELEALRLNADMQKNLLAQEAERRRNELANLEQTNPIEVGNPHERRIEEERRRIKSLRKRNEDEERRLSELEKMSLELETQLQARVENEKAMRSSLEELFEPGEDSESSDSTVLEMDVLDLQKTLAEFDSRNDFAPEVESDTPDSVLDTIEFSMEEETPAESVMPIESVETPKVASLKRPAEEHGLEQFDPNDGSLPAALMKQLLSEDDSQRSAALTDISRFGGDSAFHVITNSFDDPSTKVRNAAVRALYNLDSDCARSFTKALRDGSPQRRNRIGKAIAESGLAQDVLRDLVGESRERTYGAFSLLFLMVKAGEVGPLIHAIEEHQNVEVRLTAISLLVNSGHPDVSHLFRRFAVRGSLPAEVRSAAMEALHQLGSTT